MAFPAVPLLYRTDCTGATMIRPARNASRANRAAGERLRGTGPGPAMTRHRTVAISIQTSSATGTAWSVRRGTRRRGRRGEALEKVDCQG